MNTINELESLSKSRELELWNQLEEAISASDSAKITELLETLAAEEQARAIAMLPPLKREMLPQILTDRTLARLLLELPEAQAVEILENSDCKKVASALEQMPTEASSRLLRELEKEESAEIIDNLVNPENVAELKTRLDYEDHCAGGLMRGRPVTFRDQSTVQDLFDDLRQHASEYSDRDIQYLYVVNFRQQLVGVLQLRQVLFSPRQATLSSLMITNPFSVSATMDFHDLAEIFQKKPFLGLPVVDENDHLLGVVPREMVERASSDEQTELYLQSQGIVDGEELRSMSLFLRCRKRLAWLAPNIILNLVAASVIAANEATLQEVIALAVFLPIVSDMSGCSGNQAVAVSIRELTLGILKPRDFLRVVSKEGLVGIINGVFLGILLGSVAFLWKGNFVLSLVVAAALTLNTVISVLLGGLVPLALKSRRIDPALASGPILTTCTDMCGFFLVLTLASAVIEKLT